MSSKFSVLMPIYIYEKDDELRVAIESIINQTLSPNEILIIADKNTPQNTLNILSEYKEKYPEIFNIIKLTEDATLGKALQIGVEKAKYSLIARMDADDIARNDRFEIQMKFLKENPDIDIVGSWITEFDGVPENIYAKRELPIIHENIYKFCKFRSPINHMTVMYRKKSVIDAGNYSDRKRLEDYQLWAKMLFKGYKFANIPDFLVNVRAGSDLMKRRNNIKEYFQYEYTLFKEFYNMGFINFKEYYKAIISKFILRILPVPCMTFIYDKFLRVK